MWGNATDVGKTYHNDLGKIACRLVEDQILDSGQVNNFSRRCSDSTCKVIFTQERVCRIVSSGDVEYLGFLVNRLQWKLTGWKTSYWS